MLSMSNDDFYLGWVVKVEDPDTYAIFSKPELINQLLEPMQNPELTGETVSKPKMSFCSLNPTKVTLFKQA